MPKIAGFLLLWLRQQVAQLGVVTDVFDPLTTDMSPVTPKWNTLFGIPKLLDCLRDQRASADSDAEKISFACQQYTDY